MGKFGNSSFGKGFSIKAEVTNGRCPVCESPTVFVSLYKNFYRCMHCGGDTEHTESIPIETGAEKRSGAIQNA